MNREELIDGDGFEQIAKELGIVYCEGIGINNSLDNKFVMYHNGDGCILPSGLIRKPMNEDRFYDLHWDTIPDKLKMMFSQNVGVDDERIVCLPIGLERSRWFRNLDKHGKILDMMRLQPQRDKLIFLNINPHTNLFSRPPLIEAMKDNVWCTIDNRPNGADYNEYLHKMKEHKFVFSPEGNGLDCHRTWEALYMGAYPVMERNVFAETFAKELPILIVDKWEDVTEEFLNEQYEIINNTEWNWDMMKLSYWKDFISNTINNLRE